MIFFLFLVVIVCLICSLISVHIAFDNRNEFIELQDQFIRHLEQDNEFEKTVIEILDDMLNGGDKE